MQVFTDEILSILLVKLPEMFSFMLERVSFGDRQRIFGRNFKKEYLKAEDFSLGTCRLNHKYMH